MSSMAYVSMVLVLVARVVDLRVCSPTLGSGFEKDAVREYLI